MRKVTFISKTGHEIVEYTKADDSSINLRALALGWFVDKIEDYKG